MSAAPTAAIVADTHAVLWSLFNPARLSAAARAAFTAAEAADAPIYVSAITVVELRYLVEKRTITEADFQAVLDALVDVNTALTITPLDLDAARNVQAIPRAVVPDMPDRIIAAAALHLGLPLVTCDTRIRASSVTVVW